MNEILSLAKLPRSGLGNKMFVWAHAVVFAHANHCEWFAHGWVRLHVGPVLRGEKSWRFYRGYFRTPAIALQLRIARAQLLYRKQRLEIADCERQVGGSRTIYVFDQMPPWSDYSGPLRRHRGLVRRELGKYLHPRVQSALNRYTAPCIGVHVRMGDFRELRKDEDFAKVGLVRTPLEYFARTILDLRRNAGRDLPATIFSDGGLEELRPLLELPNVTLACDDLDIVHLLLLSKSRVIVTSAGSTFSHWAAFLSDAPVITHPGHTHAPIREPSPNTRLFEGPLPHDLSDWSDVLLASLRELR